MAPFAAPSQSPARGRLLILAAAVLWSLSGFFVPILRNETILGLNVPEVSPWHIAFFRVFFAGLILVPTLRPGHVSWRPAMLLTALSFAVMNGLLMWSMSKGKTSTAILLQYTAPMWLYLMSITFLRETPDRRSLASVLIGLLGIGLIIWDGWHNDQTAIVLMALGSGVAYALIVLGLRILRHESPRWLTIVNHLTAALAVLPVLLLLGIPAPTWPQLLCLLLFGAIQMALPYVLMARGLRSVSTQEAGTLTLLEPVLNGLWAYLVSPEQQTPTKFTILGGLIILGALFWRYAPRRRQDPPQAKYQSD
jgi:drug/metabolite transporter (DMT)-like permease